VVRESVKAKQLLKDIGWSNVLDSKPIKLKKKIIQAMLKFFNTETRMFVFNEEHPAINIRPLVQKIVGVVNGDKKVDMEGSHEDKELYTKLTAPFGQSMPAKDGVELLKNALKSVEDGNPNEHDNREFCILFILEAFGYYLGTKSNKRLERSYLHFFKGKTVQDLKDMAWCDLIADILLDSIVNFLNGEVSFCFGAVGILEVTDVLSSECL
jgi:hypothetical protein